MSRVESFVTQCQGLESELVDCDLITGYLIIRVLDHTQDVKQREKGSGCRYSLCAVSVACGNHDRNT